MGGSSSVAKNSTKADFALPSREDDLRKRIAQLEAANATLSAQVKSLQVLPVEKPPTAQNGTSEKQNMADNNPLPESPVQVEAAEFTKSANPPAGASESGVPVDEKSEWKAITIIVLGATGDLAKKKTFPALFALFRAGRLPKHVRIIGYGRTKWSQSDLEAALVDCLKDVPERAQFVGRCSYQSGAYDSEDDVAALNAACRELEEKNGLDCEQKRQHGTCSNRLFYFAIPPFAYAGAARAIKRQAMSKTGWTRMVIEKPFGKDLDSYLELAKALSAELDESELYRIDHYLGKEMTQNLLFMRFSNSLLEPLWSRAHVACVRITFQEDFGIEGRGSYFDEYGIIRDVIQNHIIQLLAIVAMEPPTSLDAKHIRDRKVEVLKCIEPIKLEDLVVGQYVASADGKQAGYRDDKTVPDGSVTPTYAAMVFYINNPRWQGVPFLLTAGKALEKKLVDIRQKPDNHRNEVIMRVQPDEAILLRMMVKEPGLGSAGRDKLITGDLDLTYKDRFPTAKQLPDAYERLIRDALQGDSSLFVRDDELAASWKIFTPVLKELERNRVVPDEYPFGSRGPSRAAELLRRSGYVDTP